MKKTFLLYLLICLLLLFSSNVYANNDDFCPFCGWPNMMMWGGEGMFMGLLFLLFIGLVIYLIFKSTKTTPTETRYKEDTALEILKQRYAKGEIKKEDFEKMKKDLKD